MTMAAPTCALCGKAPSARVLLYSSKCAVIRKPVCDPCARAVQLPQPFTLEPLPGAK